MNERLRAVLPTLGMPWILLVAAAAAIVSVRVQLGGIGPAGALLSIVCFAGLAVAAARAPIAGFGLALVLAPVLPYAEAWVGLDKDLYPLLLFAVALGASTVLTRERLDAMDSIAVPTALFAAVLFASAVVSTLRYSPFLARLIPLEAFRAFSLADAPGIEAVTTRFVMLAAAFVSGPLLALVLIGECRGAGVDAVRLRLGRLVGALSVAWVVSALVALAQFHVEGFPLPSRHPVWPTGLVTNPGALATLIAMLTPVWIGLLADRRTERWARGTAALALIVGVAAVGPLDSKTGYAGIVVGPLLFALVWLLARSSGSARRKGLWAAAAGAVVVAGFFGAAQLLAALGVSDWGAFASESIAGFRPGRLERARQLLLMFGDHPIAGAGVGTFTMLLPRYYETYGAIWNPTILEATNHVLHLAAAMGLFGLVFGIWVLGAFLAPLLRTVLDAGARPRPLEVGLGAGALAYLGASNWQGETFHYLPVATPFWLLMGGLVAVLGCRELSPAWLRDARLPVALAALYAIALLLYL